LQFNRELFSFFIAIFQFQFQLIDETLINSSVHGKIIHWFWLGGMQCIIFNVYWL